MSEAGASNEPPIPERIGRFEVLVPIGKGGMATVYLARAEVVQGVTRDYALKVMHAHLRGDPEWATHLLHEARIAARIRHPNVVPVVEAGDDPLGLYLVLDYIEGDTLSGLSRALRKQNKTLPLRVSGRILIDALAGLHAAHELRDEAGEPVNLVHRDFSPQNILVGVDGIGRLTDFGIAKAQGSQVTATGILKGKISYMSPEQARGSRVDRRCDVWAAGVIAWELLAGRRLYPNKNETETLLAIVQKSPPLLRSVNPDLSLELEAAAAGALTANVEERTPSAEALAKSLETAWRNQFGLAGAAEVANLVRFAVESTTTRRRSQIARVLATRAGESGAKTREISGEALVTPADASSRDSLVLEDPVGQEKESATGFQVVTSTQRTRKVAIGAGAVVLALIVGAAAVVALSTPLGARRGAHEPRGTQDAGFVTTAEDSGPTSPSAASFAPDAPVVPSKSSLVVRANQRLVRLRLGRRSIEISPPAKRVEVQLEPSEVGEELEVEATNEANKTTTARVSKTKGTVTVEFEAPRRPAPRPTPKPKPKPVDELAPTPFKKGGSK